MPQSEAVQLQLFPQEYNIVIRREKRDGKDLYIAELFGGWWVGHGNTPDAAIKQVIKHYDKEHNPFN